MGRLLFSPDGIIGKSEFTKGAVILLAVNFFLWLAWYGSFGLGLSAALLSFLLIYCWFCLFAKRFRSAGKSPAWFILLFIIFVIGSYILASFLAIIMSAEIVEKAQEFQEIQRNDPENPAVIFPAVADLMKAFAIPYAIAYFLFGALCAFLPNAAMGQSAAQGREDTFD